MPSLLTYKMIGTLRRRKLDLPLSKVLKDGIQRLNSLTNDSYQVPVVGWRGQEVDVHETSNVVSIFLMNATRPPSYKFVCFLNESNMVLVPSIQPKDLLELYTILALENLSDIVALEAICRKDYGVYEKGCPPMRIETVEDAERCGFELTNELKQVASVYTSLWWQKWGGFLYSFTFDPRPANPVLHVQNYNSLIGHYERNPIRR